MWMMLHANALGTVRKTKETTWWERTPAETNWSWKHKSAQLAICGSVHPPFCLLSFPRVQNSKHASQPARGSSLTEASSSSCREASRREAWGKPEPLPWPGTARESSLVGDSQFRSEDGHAFPALRGKPEFLQCEDRETFLAFLIVPPMVGWMLAPKDVSVPQFPGTWECYFTWQRLCRCHLRILKWGDDPGWSGGPRMRSHESV